MSRYSSNLASCFPGVCSPLGFSTKKRRPGSMKPSTFPPPSWVSVLVWADATPAPARIASAARRNPAVRVCRIGGPLACEPAAGWVIGAVDDRVAVVARPPDHEFLGAAVPAVRSRRVLGLRVALLAEPRPRQLQHRLVVRAVGIVAVRAALDHRLVAPEKGTPLLRVAGEARVVHRRLLEQGGRDGPVRVVARGAGHLALAHRHVRAPHRLGSLLEVAGAAGLDLGGLGELALRRGVLHQLVAVGAGHVAGLVAAPLPEDPGALGVTVEADRVPLLHRRLVVLREGDHPAHALAAARVHVRLAWAVAALAGAGLLGTARLEEEEAPHPGLGELAERLLVTALAGLRADVVAVRGCGRGGGRLCRLLGVGGERKAEDDPGAEQRRRRGDPREQPPPLTGHRVTPLSCWDLRPMSAGRWGSCPPSADTMRHGHALIQ